MKKYNYTKKILVYAISICIYIITSLLYPFLLEKIEYLVVPKIVCMTNFLFGIILFLYSMINLDSKLVKFFQREIERKTNIEHNNPDSEVVKLMKPLSPLKNKLLEYDKFTLPMWSIWLFFEVFCLVVCASTIISAEISLKSQDTTIFLAEGNRQKSWLCITEDTHLPNGTLTSMIDYQYNDNGILDMKIYYDGEGNIEKYEDYIYNNKRYLVETEVYKPVYGTSEAKQEFYHDASDVDNKLYVYNKDGMCIFERSGANSERKYEYIYDKKGRVSDIACALNNKFEYLHSYKYRFDGNIKEEKIHKSKPILLFNRWGIYIKSIPTRYIYNNLGNLVKTEYNDGTTANYIYDEYNNIIRKDVSVNGIKTYYIEYTYALFECTSY